MREAIELTIVTVPSVVCTRLDAHRGYRAIGIPLWWFGIVVLVGGLRKTCLVIYLFGVSVSLLLLFLAIRC